MLKPVVEDADGATEALLGEASSEITIRRDEYRRTRERTRQHLRLVARSLDGLEHAFRIADHDHALVTSLARVAAAQNRGSLAHLAQHARKCFDHRRLTTAADNQVANTDDRPIELAPCLRTLLIPGAPQTCDPPVD